MLRKLLKYDLRANMKIFLFVWPAIVLFALLERLAISANLNSTLSSILINTTTTLYVLAVVAACVFALVISVMRFYSGLLRDEGYLMFTLPVKPWQLVLSKLLTALLTVTVTVVLSILSTIILFTGVNGFLDGLREMVRDLNEVFSALSWILMVLLCLAGICVGILQIYLSCSLGHLFRRHRVLFSVLAYYVINVVLEAIVVNGMILISAANPENALISGILHWFGGMSLHSAVSVLLAFVLLGYVLLGCMFYFVTEWILRKHLNLE